LLIYKILQYFVSGSYWTLTGRELGLAKRSSLDVLMRNDSHFDFVPI